jgi:small subunit ribosomal protein S21e
MQNDKGEYIDSYIPRKCSASNRIISARDHASIQINIAEVDPVRGVMTGTYKTYALCGSIRQMGESDDSINTLSKRDALLPSNF